MEVFQVVSEGTVAFNGTFMELPRPRPPEHELISGLQSSNPELVEEALAAVSPPYSSLIDRILVDVANRSKHRSIVSLTARRLGLATTDESLHALKRLRRFRKSKVGIIAVAEVACALHRRGLPAALKRLGRHAPRLHPRLLGDLVTVLIARKEDLRLLPARVAKQVAESENGRFLSLAVGLAHKEEWALKRVRQEASQDDRARIEAVAALSVARTKVAPTITADIFRTSESIEVKLACVERAWQMLGPEEVAKILSTCSRASSPVIRFRAAALLSKVSPETRQAIKGDWLSREPDQAVRRALEARQPES